MANLYVKNIPDELYREVQKIAASQGQSLSAFVAQMFREAVEDKQRVRRNARLLASMRKRRARLSLSPDAPDVADVVRELRERGRDA